MRPAKAPCPATALAGAAPACHSGGVRRRAVRGVILSAISAIALAMLLTGCPPSTDSGAGSGGSGSAHADTRTYTCRMHCKLPGHDEPYTQQGPGSCPVCGMTLVPVPDAPGGGGAQGAPPATPSGHSGP